MARRTAAAKKQLIATAKKIADALAENHQSPNINIWPRRRVLGADTDGWVVEIGDLGQPGRVLHIWLDRFSGHRKRTYCASIGSYRRDRITSLTKEVAKRLWPIRTVDSADTKCAAHLRLSEPLAQSEFNRPILETHARGETYYGFYDDSDGFHFVPAAVAFFVDVADCLSKRIPTREIRDVYPRVENRTLATRHIRRERSGLLAIQRKIRDEFVCKVCDLRFTDVYGALGRDFAECHHVIALSTIDSVVETDIDDLITVCANCHRMLHKMAGEPGDVAKLRAIVKRHQRRQ